MRTKLRVEAAPSEVDGPARPGGRAPRFPGLSDLLHKYTIPSDAAGRLFSGAAQRLKTVLPRLLPALGTLGSLADIALFGVDIWMAIKDAKKYNGALDWSADLRNLIDPYGVNGYT